MSALKNLSLTSGLFIAVFILSIASAQNDLDLSSEIDLEALNEIQELLRNVQIIYEMKIANNLQKEMKGGRCSCADLSCSCCKHIRIKKLRINKDCCLKVTYHPDKQAIEVALTLGTRALFSKEVPVKDPPPVCSGAAFVRNGFTACIEFHDINVDETSYKACGKFVARISGKTVLKLELGCYEMNLPSATKQVEAIELPFFDGPQASVEFPGRIYLGDVPMEEFKPGE